ncbi:MAG: carboxylating nicotinate-nucleotide diphosphorylase [Bacteroidetes bacterium]|nr:carboxylating nicotinate-nucleotide diphosphorylase [Bacteroidota bacterium]
MIVIYKQFDILPKEYIENKINEYLAEDGASSDYTTIYTVPQDTEITAVLEAEEEFVFAGKSIIEVIFKECKVEILINDGDRVKAGTTMAKIIGNASYILTRERVMLNIIQRLSGIATTTRKYVDAVKDYDVHVYDTRKTTPGMRLFQKYAVRIGGAYNHRYNLESDILIKDNHIAAAGGVTNALQNIFDKMKNKKINIELEVVSIEQIIEGLNFDINGILLDNMKPENVKKCVEFIRNSPNGENIFIEASGGINYNTIVDYAKTGVDGISVGALTHNIKSSNMHLVF